MEIKKGDRVVTSRFDRQDSSKGNEMVDQMYQFVDCEGEVTFVTEDYGFRMYTVHGWKWPESAVRLVGKANQDSPTSPSHYKAYDIEAIEMMIRIWGKEEAAIFCKLSAFGYRLRMGMKDDVSIELGKEKWFLNKWKELKDDVAG